MTRYRYLIIGGGMTADAAVPGIRSADTSGSIGLIAAERDTPYRRPPLSKGLWKGEAAETIWLNNARQHATIHSSRKATRILPEKKQVIDDHGETYEYGKLLLATGGTVRKLPGDAAGPIYFRTYADYELLRKRATKGSSAIVVGGGFIGSEVAASLAATGVRVTMVFREGSIGARVYPGRLSTFLTEFYASKGVDVLPQTGIAAIAQAGNSYRVTTSAGKELHADVVVAGLGIQPDTSLAAAAGLDVQNGIVVNEFLQTSHPDIYAAGDVANFFSPALNKRVRVEHEDNALTMGELAGRNMAGAPMPYRHLPFFYSDLFELGYEAVGELDSRLETVEEWKEEFREGVVYYLEHSTVRGVLLWNTWGQVENARAMIASQEPFAKSTARIMKP
jgi:3-phenylpropionate/trans-cinnamate dioxygenase ferredoxin reductase component